MKPARPYLLRAMHDWITDNGYTPYILVNAQADGVNVPQEHAVDGKIIFNVSNGAVRGLDLSNDGVCFSARFSGQARDLYIPMQAIEAIYAKENGQGMVFNDEETGDDGSPNGNGSGRRSKPNLTVVK